jgi:hypothetical protein
MVRAGSSPAPGTKVLIFGTLFAHLPLGHVPKFGAPLLLGCLRARCCNVQRRSGFIPGNLHRDSFIDPSPHHVSNCCPPKVMQQLAQALCLSAPSSMLFEGPRSAL